MTQENKTIQIEFAPGCFDDFDGTQEELDQLQAELLQMFSELTPEELALRSSPVDLEAMALEDPESAEKILNFLNDEPNRNLQ